jgi:hypothetical protein
MLAIRELRKVAWHRLHVRQPYVGYLTLTDEAVRLSGREAETGIDVALSIPLSGIDRVRRASDACLDADRAIVLELADGEPIRVVPIECSRADLERLARRLTAAVESPHGLTAIS